jgi:dynein heavy chain
MPNPPAGVRLTMQAASVMFEVKPILKDDPMYPTRKKPDWWATAQRYLLAGA